MFCGNITSLFILQLILKVSTEKNVLITKEMSQLKGERGKERK